MNLRYVLLIMLSILFWRHGQAQYPSAGAKQRLGYQTTGDGLVYRGNGSPAYTPSGINSAWAYIDTTAGTIYTYYAGSWHLVSAGGGGSFDGHVDSLVFNTDVTVVDSVGKMYYDAANETISVGIDGGSVYQLGQELYYPLVINKSGATIHNGQPVMVDTATLVTGDHVRIIPARNGAAYPSEYVMGVVTADIPNDSTGLVTWFGYVREVKQSDIAQTGITLNAGDILYISATEPGKYTNIRPSSPAHQSTVALVVRKPSINNITLLVRPWLAPKLDNLSNVNVTSVTGLSVLRYNSTTGIWDASATPGIVAADTAAMLSYYLRKADTTAMLVPYQKDITLTTTGTSGAATFNGVTLNVPQYQAALTNPVTGTGADGQVAYWSGTGTQAGSNSLFWDNTNARLGVGTNAPTDELQVRKDINDFAGIEVTNANTGASVLTRYEQMVGATTSSSANYRLLNINTAPKNYTNAFIGGTYGSGGTTVLMYGGTDTTNNHITHAITNLSGVSENNFNPSFRWVKAVTNNYTVANELMRLNKTGLGIGTTNPGRELDVVGVARVQRGTDDAGVILQRTGTGTKVFLLGVGASGSNNGYFTIADGGADGSTGFTRRFYIDNIGRVGIASSSPAYTLDINATDAIRLPSGTTVQRPTGAAGVLRFNSDSTALEYHNGTTWRGIVNTWDAGTGSGGGSSVWSTTADTVYLPSGKYVGIGTASPDSVLHVEGGAYLNGGLRTDVGLFMENPGYINTGIRALAGSRVNKLPNFSIYPETSEANAGTTFIVVPKGTGYTTAIKAQLVFYNTDLFADRVNTEFMTVRSTGTAGYGFFCARSGTGQKRPLYFNATGTQAVPADANLFCDTTGNVGIRNATPTSTLTINGNLARNVPAAVITSTSTVGELTNWIICDYAGTVTLTLPNAASYPGRELMIKTIRAQAVVSASSNVAPLTSNTAGTAILAATAGKWATLVSTGSVWVIMQSN